MNEISKEVLDIEPELIAWRRHFHRYPELSFKEFQTSTFIEEKLLSFGNIEVTRPTPTSVLGVIKGKEKGKTIAIRADIDALPLQEDNDLAFASVHDGVMHACGHDGHAAILLATAKVLSRQKGTLSGEVRLMFQHAEEVPPGGAVEMVEAGVMEGVDEVYGLHLSSNYETSMFCLRKGALTSATDRFDIVVKGKGGHSAFPETTIDPIVIAAQIIVGLQNIVSRQTAAIDTVVLSTCQINAGKAYNIIPDMVSIAGSTRTFGKEIREGLSKKIERIVKGITSSYGADYDFKFSLGYSSVINDDALITDIEKILTQRFGKERVIYIEPLMPGEDFSAFSEVCPGAFIDVGTRNVEKGSDEPHHNCKYKMDEDALAYGVQFFVSLVQVRLSSE
ncbi:MAG: amidohydrolase [Desulfosporosinus sp.]|nr:amidohydrolase [Desulfosporosinus sp.]